MHSERIKFYYFKLFKLDYEIDPFGNMLTASESPKNTS